MGIVIGTYNYTYGAESEPNRQIQFARSGTKLLASVYVLKAGKAGECVSSLSAEQVSVEMESTTTKASAIATGRVLKPNKLLSELGLYTQSALISALKSRSIEVSNGPSTGRGLETVTNLTIFDPS